MGEKLTNILFHPSTLIEYKNTHLLKVLLYILFLSIFSLIVPIIDTIKEPGFTIVDKKLLEETYSLKLAEASSLPDCKITLDKYECSDNEPKELFRFLTLVVVVSDPGATFVPNENKYYLKLNSDRVVLTYGNSKILTFDYEDLPSEWQTLDFTKIKNDRYPNDAYFAFFLKGYNQIAEKLIPLDIAVKVFFTYISFILETLLFAFLIYLFFGKDTNTFKELFKITAFATTFSVLVRVILDLLSLSHLSQMLTIITIFYVYIAVAPKIHEDKEF